MTWTIFVKFIVLKCTEVMQHDCWRCLFRIQGNISEIVVTHARYVADAWYQRIRIMTLDMEWYEFTTVRKQHLWCASAQQKRARIKRTTALYKMRMCQSEAGTLDFRHLESTEREHSVERAKLVTWIAQCWINLTRARSWSRPVSG